MQRPRLLDLFCGAGGAAVGYHHAGFNVTGVDHKPQKRYPFEFHQADALEFCCEHGHEYDVIHASPPCQGYTTMNQRRENRSPRLIGETRKGLQRLGCAYVIENVQGARGSLENPIELTGEMFGLRVHRPRLFEIVPFLLAPARPARQRDPVAVYGALDGRRLWTRRDGSELRACGNLEDARSAMGIDWMEWDEIREAIPPAYTEYVGRQLIERLARTIAGAI